MALTLKKDCQSISMDREISKTKQNTNKAKRIGTGVIILGLLGAAFFFGRKFLSKKVSLNNLTVATVQRGNLENTITASGLVVPSSEILVTSPISSKIKSLNKQNGDAVTPGMVIMRLDNEIAQLEYSRLQDELKVKENNVNRLQLTLRRNIKEIELDNQIKDLELQNLEAQLVDARRLLEIGGVTQEEVERAEQNINIAKLEKQKLENELNYRRASIDADVKNEELQSSIQEKVLNQLGNKISKTRVTAPDHGVITWINKSIGTQVEEGAPLARIANLNDFTIEATASDMHTEKIKIGQPVRVRINQENLLGTISQILPSVENNTIKFNVALEEANSELLKANMRVEIFIIEGKKENTIYMANGLGYKGGRAQEFFVVEDNQLVKRMLEIGLTNNKKIEILSGAEPGDRIVISDMKRYEDLNTITIKE